jgi:uncharacterized protein YwgA
MNKNIKKVIAVLKNLGIKPDIEVYEWRFFIQKVIHLSKCLGISFDYDFTLYLSGPYCPTLTQDYYDYSSSVQNLETDYSLKKNELDILSIIKNRLFNKSVKNVFLEAVSTIVHLKKITSEISDDQIFETVKSLKPYIKDSMIVIARNKAKELMFKPEFLTPEIQAEIDEWDSINDLESED